MLHTSDLVIIVHTHKQLPLCFSEEKKEERILKEKKNKELIILQKKIVKQLFTRRKKEPIILQKNKFNNYLQVFFINMHWCGANMREREREILNLKR